MQLRRATAADLDLVQSISHDAYAPWVPILGAPPLPMTLDYSPRIEQGEVWLAGDDALIVVETWDGHLTIWSLAIRPESQGRGLGQWLMGEAERMARDAGLVELRLYTHPKMTRNVAIYERAGYRETGRRPNPYRPGWILIDMARPVNPHSA